MGSDKQKDPEKKDIEFILDLLRKSKFIDAENKIYVFLRWIFLFFQVHNLKILP